MSDQSNAQALEGLLRRALPMLVKLGDYIGNGDVTPDRSGSLGERCDLILDIKGAIDEAMTGPQTVRWVMSPLKPGVHELLPDGGTLITFTDSTQVGFPTMTADEIFFFKNAGWSYDPKTETEHEGRLRGAQRLAQAEQRMKAGPYAIRLEPDPEPWDGDFPYDGPLWIVELWDTENNELLGSLCSVAAEEFDDYLRVVAAELADEHIPDSPRTKTITLNLTEYQRGVLSGLLDNDLDRSEREGTSDSPWCEAVTAIREQIPCAQCGPGHVGPDGLCQRHGKPVEV